MFRVEPPVAGRLYPEACLPRSACPIMLGVAVQPSSLFMHLASIALTLFLVLDPFGNIVPVNTIMQRVPEHKRLRVLLRENLIALGILLFFLFAGSFVLSLLAVREDALRISGGILLFIIAIGMVFPQKSVLHEPDTGEPFIVPISVPFIAGPSAIALLLTFSARFPQEPYIPLSALLLAWSGSLVVLALGGTFIKLLGKRGTHALERLMGLLLVLIAVQMFLDGVKTHFETSPTPPPAAGVQGQLGAGENQGSDDAAGHHASDQQ